MDQLTPSPAKKCPICGKPAEQLFQPFCSRRCANVDLHRWFSGSYTVPVENEEIPDEESSGLRDEDDST
jgi:endogenous inhibitor of DNA gyrase (YacG/DUF329 family)